MAQSSKDKVREVVRRLSSSAGALDTGNLQASHIADELHLSRSMASSYLNALHQEGVLIKIASRPALFFDRKTLEGMNNVHIDQDEFLSISEFQDYLSQRRGAQYDFEDVIGAVGSLREVVERIKAALCYPSSGLAFLLAGYDALGKRELCEAASRWSVSQGIARGQESVRALDAGDEEAVMHLRGMARTRSMLRDAGIDLLVMTSCERLDEATWTWLLASSEDTPLSLDNQGTRLLLECNGIPEIVLPSDYLRSVPVVCTYPSLVERPVDEREQYVYRALRRQAELIGCQVLASMNAIRRLIAIGDREESQIADIESASVLACANALASRGSAADGAEPLKVLAAHVSTGTSLQVGVTAADEGSAFVDVAAYDSAWKDIDALDALDAFIRVFSCLPVTQAPSPADEAKAFQALSHYFELIGASLRGPSRTVIDPVLIDSMGSVFERCGMNEPVGFASRLAETLAFFRSHRLAITASRARRQEAVQKAAQVLERHYSYENSVMANLGSALADCWGWEIEAENRLLLSFYLHWCIRDQAVRCAGVIVAHGYSTASSIAASVNAILRQHVFDALDMPLDSGMDEIVHDLERYVSRMPLRQDLLIMVDMGSLETIGDNLNLSFGIDVGVIDNVSTAPALEAGALIMQQRAVAEILPSICQKAQCRYTLHRGIRTRRAILFVSENGTAAARRLAELFFSSLPKSLDLDAVPCDFLTVAEQVHDGRYQDEQILFVLGTSDPGIAGVTFVLLDDIIDMAEDDEIEVDLSAYLDQEDLEELRGNLVRNFTLQNLMRHLTILEPDRLMEAASNSIEQLQRNLGIRFSYRMLMRLYVHLGYLIERLVTRRYMNDENTTAFEREEPEFIARVRSSLQGITETYGVDLPMSEIHYVYNLVHFKEPRRKAMGEEDFFRADDI